MVLVICGAAKKAWFRTIQEVYCWGERIPRWLCKLKPSIAEQAEKRLGLQSVPSAWLVALWNLTELQQGLTSGQRFIWKSWLEDLPLRYLSSSTYVVFSSGIWCQTSDGYCLFRDSLCGCKVIRLKSRLRPFVRQMLCGFSYVSLLLFHSYTSS